MNKKRCLVIVVVVAVAVLLAILFDTMPANHRPIITSLEAEADWTTPSGSLQVTCTASDSDGDKLSYNWSASRGKIIWHRCSCKLDRSSLYRLLQCYSHGDRWPRWRRYG